MRYRALYVLATMVAAGALVTPAVATAQSQPADSAFVRREVMIPMRDGKRLFTVILTPASQSGSLPMLMRRTPYSAAVAAGRIASGVNYRELARDGYIFVTQDIRGRYRSEGTFVMNRPPRRDRSAVDESTDTWDTIEWLVSNVRNHNGRVGILGVSYPGWLTDMALIDPHPALKAVSPQATMGDTWMGDDFFHQGAFRLSYGVEYVWGMEASPDGSVDPAPARYDTYSWYRSFPSHDSLARTIGARNWPTWRAFVEHPAYDVFWQARAVPSFLRHTTVPTLTVGGWWDQEDIGGYQSTYRAREASDSAQLNYFVSGPWFHGQWDRDSGDSLGNIQFGSPTSVYFREQVEVPWFAYWLKDRGSRNFPEALVFDAGARAWTRYDAWPPRNAARTSLYFHEDGRLSVNGPTSQTGSDGYVSDPRYPVPYRPRPVEWTYDPRGSRWRRWLTEDQRFVEGRPDVLVWQTEPLTEDITIAGDVTARLFAATTGSDADWVVKLIDVYPDTVADRPGMGGYQLMVAGEILRGRYRTSFEKPAPITPNQTLAYTIDLHQQAYTFKRGHRIMVQLQSTWFPLYDRNPQTYVPNIFLAKADDYRPQTHTIARTAAAPSHVEVMVVPGQSGTAERSATDSAGVRFMRDMIGHHEQALDMTRLVPGRSSRAEIKLLAERIEVSQREEIGRIRSWLVAQGVKDTTTAHRHTGHALMQGMLSSQEIARLAATEGVAFDRLFLEFMIRHHEGALTMVEQLLSAPDRGQDPALFGFAADLDADQRAEIARMRRLLSTLN